MGLKNLYIDIYEQFAKKSTTVKGYHFQDKGAPTVPPKTVSFKDKLRAWTFDRPKRMRAISQERDRQQQEILALKQTAKHPTTTPPSPSD
ncbi:MAG: hypothetical protein VST68_03500 [Nitrospirota bacterium]|nr:hypothetical protein [Nitrospirota bacterium]